MPARVKWMKISIEDYEKLRPVVTFRHEGRSAYYHVPNRMTLWRVETLLSKEPSTIAWLNKIRAGETLLDVGANVGMYSIYAACFRDAIVYAFEPESQNYALLNANIYENKLSGRVHAYCLALSDRAGLDKLFLSNFAQGTSCHSLGEEVGFDLQPRKSPFAQGIYSQSIDELIAGGALPVPDYIKVDVDGFEHKVIQGAARTLVDPKVKSIIIELNPHLPEHLRVVEQLQQLGFAYDTQQVHEAARQDGTFKDVGEWIFYRKQETKMSGGVVHTHIPSVIAPPDAETQQMVEHVLNRVRATPISAMPFVHAVVDNVFPPEYYASIQAMFPPDTAMIPLSETGRTRDAYKERLVTLFDEDGFSRLTAEQRQFWAKLGAWLYSPDFINGMIDYFRPHVAARINHLTQRFGRCDVRGDALIVSDKTEYAIGPHTDAMHRLISFLFYLPQNDQFSAYGTSLYVPKDPRFTSDGGMHYGFDGFERSTTIGFIPNRLVIFVRSDKSFHGVERIDDPSVERRLLINNIRLVNT